VPPFLEETIVLILIPTPLGNLTDISERVKRELTSVDYLLTEDTRHTAHLFSALCLTPPQMFSLHKFNEAARLSEIVSLLKEGKKVGLVSDAGMPGISDPGALLVALCHKEKIPVSVLPGPSAFVCAFAVSGIVELPFQFLGFLPKADGELSEKLSFIREYPGSSVAYESPHRFVRLLEKISSIDPHWEIVIVRELSKIHEEIIRSPAEELLAYFAAKEVKGEIVVVFTKIEKKQQLGAAELVQQVKNTRERFSCSVKEAVEIVASMNNCSKREVYQLCLE
jgi:16S rRNA (cytidine1402-2'-O)-methyltransferase